MYLFIYSFIHSFIFIYYKLFFFFHKPCKYDCSLLDTQSIADITPSCFTFSKDFDNLFFMKYTEQYNINTNAIQRNPIKIYKIYTYLTTAQTIIPGYRVGVLDTGELSIFQAAIFTHLFDLNNCFPLI